MEQEHRDNAVVDADAYDSLSAAVDRVDAAGDDPDLTVEAHALLDSAARQVLGRIASDGDEGICYCNAFTWRSIADDPRLAPLQGGGNISHAMGCPGCAYRISLV